MIHTFSEFTCFNIVLYAGRTFFFAWQIRHNKMIRNQTTKKKKKKKKMKPGR
jgi:hypothetical protein